MREGLKSQSGLTLIEVLASFVILGIAFIGIMTVFPQMALFNEKTGTKLNTMNLAKQEMAELTVPMKWEKLFNPDNPETYRPDFLTEEKIVSELQLLSYQPVTSDAPGTYLRFVKDGEYKYEVDFYTACEPFPGQAACMEMDRIKLYKLHMKVMEAGRISSEAYGYVSYAFKEPGETN